MHKLATTPITLDCFETDDMKKNLQYYETNDIDMFSDLIIEQLEFLRQKYLKTKDKAYWKELIRWLPESWLQTRTVTMNYENLITIAHQRKNHKLTEWNTFIYWIRTLPYAQWFIFYDEHVPFKIT